MGVLVGGTGGWEGGGRTGLFLGFPEGLDGLDGAVVVDAAGEEVGCCFGGGLGGVGGGAEGENWGGHFESSWFVQGRGGVWLKMILWWLGWENVGETRRLSGRRVSHALGIGVVGSQSPGLDGHCAASRPAIALGGLLGAWGHHLSTTFSLALGEAQQPRFLGIPSLPGCQDFCTCASLLAVPQLGLPSSPPIRPGTKIGVRLQVPSRR